MSITEGLVSEVEPLLAARGVSAGYHGVPVVQAADIQLRPGRVTVLVGPNGSGKSTLLRSLARLHRPLTGDVLVATEADEQDAFALSGRDFARRVALLAQNRPVPTGVQVQDVVGYGRYPYRGRWRAADPDGARAIEWAMRVTGVGAMAGRGVDELSGGELQRVWLASCLAQDTRVLLLDEPTTFLDLRYQVEILDLVRDLATEHGVAAGLVLHDLNQAAGIADDLVLLSNGRVQSAGAPEDVCTATALSEAYGIPIRVGTDPVTGRPSTTPVGRHLGR